MRQRVLLAGLVLALVGATVVAMAQPVAPVGTTPITPPPIPAIDPVPPAPPRTLAGTPAVGGPPAAQPTEAVLSQFLPLDAFPAQIQDAVRGVLFGASWLTRMGQPNGRFRLGLNPALHQPLMGDHDLKQARAALALAQAAKFAGDEKQATIAAQTILTLLAATRVDPADPNCRIPVHSAPVCNRVAFAATVALAIYELPAADTKLIAEAERLCEFLHKQCRADGSVHDVDDPSVTSAQVDPAGVNESPGMALHAIVAGNRLKPAAWKTEVTKKGIEYYRRAFQSRPHPLLAATLTPTCAELYLQTRLSEAATIAFELNDWLCGLQISGSDPRSPQWAGGFRTIVDGQQSDAPPGPETGLCLQSMARACELARLTADGDRHAKYKGVAIDASHFLTRLQYLETNTRHFENSFRATQLIGGFHLSPTDGNLRIDATATATTGLLAFLSSVVERN